MERAQEKEVMGCRSHDDVGGDSAAGGDSDGHGSGTAIVMENVVEVVLEVVVEVVVVAAVAWQ